MKTNTNWKLSGQGLVVVLILLAVIMLLPQGMSQLWRREPAVAGE